jgi:phosphopantothenoylcysteine decarboxylase/phosphopantothenoylcysteine decarboxylase/phosphopantothenate--cysteine ligase
VKNIILGVTGSIAAYKAADIANKLTKAGWSVHVIMTEAAKKFITPLTMQTLSKNKVETDMFAEFNYAEVNHISLTKKADICLIAPATANIIGKLASGVADDMLTTVTMAMNGKPVFIAPAMNTAMYENPITQKNINALAEYGYRFIEPKSAELACGDLGRGALADTDVIIATVTEYTE